MKRNFLLQILALSALLSVSCREVAIDSDYPEWNGQYLSVLVDTPDSRTRAIDLNPGAALFLKNIWVGVYDVTNGNKVGGGEVELGRMLTASGNTLVDLVPIKITGTLVANRQYCIVGVANYDDKIMTYNGNKLYTELSNANSWNAFTQIAIDTQKSEFENQVPLLVGYLHRASSTYSNIKVNQFATGNGINLIDFGESVDIFATKSATSNTINTANFVLKLRRLRSKINVVINEEPVPGVTVTNLQYKICNAPASAFLAQRRTNSFGDMDADVAHSPNSADVLTNGSKDGYFETEYVSPQVNTNFSFEHFENLHWARYTEGLKEYHDREKKEPNGAFSALATSTDDWNNRATYFVLKMNIRDDNLGRNAEVEYTIHEGFCNDANGNSLVDDAGNGNLSQRLLDFACVRNTDYYYKITVKSIDDIFVQVTESDKHTTDQQGKIWDIDYVTDVPVSSAGGDTVKKGITLGDLNNAKDIAFRFVGSYYDTEQAVEIPVDICYNFKRGDLDGFAGLWNAPTNESSEYIVATGEGDEYRSAYQALTDFCNGSSDNAAHFNRMIDEIQVKYRGEYYNIKDYLGQVTGDDNPNPDIEGFKFSGLKYYEAFDEANDNKRNHLRGLYIFDVQKAVEGGTRVQRDDDGCTMLYKINGIEQVPNYLDKENYKMIYVAGNNPIGPKETRSFTTFGDREGMLLSERPELAFRLLGFDGNTDDYYDFLYNFTQNEYKAFTEERDWPAMNLNDVYTMEIAKGGLGVNTIPQSFLEGMTILVNGNEYDIYSFVTGYERGTIQLSDTDKVGFKVYPYAKNIHTSMPDKYKRALYLFDKKNKFVKPVLLAEDGKSATFQAYAVEQSATTTDAIRLALPTNLPTTYSSSKQNFVDPYLDEIRLPVISGVDPADYRYKITFSSGSSEYIVDVAPVNNYFTFNIPMKYVPGSGRITVSAQVVATNDKYKDALTSRQIGTVTLTNPSWDFSDNNWADEFKSWGNYTNNQYYKFDSGNKTRDNKLYVRSNGKEVRGYPNNRLYFNSGSCDLLITTYKNCRVSVTTEVKADRTLNISPGNPASHDISKNGTSVTITSTSSIDIELANSTDISINFGGGGAYLYKVEMLNP